MFGETEAVQWGSPEAKPAGVMCSYAAENGVPSCANDWLLNKVLRSWKPDAMVSTDCGAVPNLQGAPVFAPDAVHAAAFALMNGTDLEMGESLFTHLSEAIQQGRSSGWYPHIAAVSGGGFCFTRKQPRRCRKLGWAEPSLRQTSLRLVRKFPATDSW